jgi:hypothetical protein
MQLIDFTQDFEARDPYGPLESGNILFFPEEGSGLSEADKNFLRGVGLAGGSLHKNVAYKPVQDRVSGFKTTDSEAASRLAGVMRHYARWAAEFTGRVLPRYKNSWKADYASFRPEEEKGRDLSWKKRNDLLHVDAFPSRPTNGDLILRVFTNINENSPRVWLTSDPVEQIIPLYARNAGLGRIPANRVRRSLIHGLKSIGLPLVERSPYDEFMLRFHDYLKGDKRYQESCTKYRFEFPAGSTWMVFTDVVPHAVLEGQFALEQTFLVARAALSKPELAPASIIERLVQRTTQ